MSQIKIIIGDKIKDIEKLYDKMDKNSEFEIIFFPKTKEAKYIGQDKYINLIKYLKYLSRKEKMEIKTETTLDIAHKYDDTTVNRITISDEQYIKKFTKKIIDYANNNTLIYKFALMMLNKEDNKNNWTIISKIKNKENVIDINELDIRIRLSTEKNIHDQINNLIKTLDFDTNQKISYRYKDRLSLYLYKDKNTHLKIDLTFVKTTKNINELNTCYPTYELEIESMTDNKKTNNLDIMLDYSEKLLKIIQQSNFIISNISTQNIINSYKSLLSLPDHIKMMVRRDPISLEVQHIVEILPDQYSVTDKADGDRNLLLIINGSVYLMSTNLEVKDTGIELTETIANKYNNSILDGEYIYIQSENRHMFMVFDCLRIGNTDIRNISTLETRLSKADEIIDNCFIFGKQSGYTFKQYEKNNFNLDKIVLFHENEIKDYMKKLNNDILLEKKYPLIRRKYFIFSFGANKWEIYKYATLIWKLYVSDNKIKCPYVLDGLIFQPLEQTYVTNAEDSKLFDFKWKPPNKNSIDFYIIFKKDQNNKTVSIYDNSNKKYAKDKLYKICNLYVGKKYQGKEQYVQFNENDDLNEAYLFLNNGEIRDIEGNIITTNTVVEFYYNDNETIPPKFRWVPIRTRYDKTESVRRFGKRYGNHADTANKIWRSIINPVLMDDFIELGKGNISGQKMYYDDKIELIKKKIEHKLIVSTAKEDKYYQVQTKLASNMTQFHNWVKSNIIYTYCNHMYANRKLSVLDYGVGRGGDTLKYYYSNVDFVVGFDQDKETIYSAVNGPISRYNQFKKNYPNFPKMYFLQADGNSVLEYDAQIKALGTMDMNNKNIFLKFFPNEKNKRTLFDVINCQFVVHYMFKDNITFNNFKQNINLCLKEGGYLLISTFNGQKLYDLLKGKEKITTHYTDSNSIEKILFEIIKKYDDNDKNKGTGIAIDLHASWMFNEGKYVTEYMVYPDFLCSELDRDCDMELVDSDSFENQFNINRDFFTDTYKTESVELTKKFFTKIAAYYEKNNINTNFYTYTFITSYYIFRKRDIKK